MTEQEKQYLITEIQHIPTNTEETVYYIGQFTLYDGTTHNQLSKGEREERNKQFRKEFNEMVERVGDSITTDQVIKKCKRDRRFYEELLMKLDDGVLFTD